MHPTTFIRRFFALDRHPLGSLGWRVLACTLAMRPWQWRFQPVTIRVEDLDPDLLALAKSEGVDVLDRSLYLTQLGVAGRLAAIALLLALIWWTLARLRRTLVRRRGPGFLSTLVPLMGLPALVGALIVWGIPRILDYQSPLIWNVPVWGGWVIHPLLSNFSMAPWLVTLGLGILVLEVAFQAMEGRLLLAEAREGALRARLSPHFLHNAFNTLGAQIRRDPEGAQETTQRLSALFDQVCRAAQRPTLPLREELALVEELLSMERHRLGDRLKVEVEVPEELLDREVPVLALQLLVENALKHALAPRPEGGQLRITATALGAGLEVAVTDSGDGRSLATPGTGQSLSNLRARLRRPSDLRLEVVPEGHRASFRWTRG